MRLHLAGLSTKSSPLWWLSGFKRRQLNMGSELDESNLESLSLIHFTVRLFMAQNRNKCRVLRNWEQKLGHDGRVYWGKRGKTLSEDTLRGSEDSHSHEYTILKEWCNDSPPPMRTDRSIFAARVHALGYDAVEDIEGRLGRFAAFLRGHMVFDENNLLAPKSTYRRAARQ